MVEDPGYVVPPKDVGGPVRKEDVGTERALSAFLLLFAVNAVLGLACLGMATGGVLIAREGGWSVLVRLLLLAGGLGGAIFFAGGVWTDYRETGVSFRREAANAWRRLRRRPGGRQQFASQRFTGNARRRS